MKKVFMGTTLVVSVVQSAAGTESIQLKNVGVLGIAPERLKEALKESGKVDVTQEDLLKVDYSEEGREIKFDTLDGHSVIIPIETAPQGFNKGDKKQK